MPKAIYQNSAQILDSRYILISLSCLPFISELFSLIFCLRKLRKEGIRGEGRAQLQRQQCSPAPAATGLASKAQSPQAHPALLTLASTHISLEPLLLFRSSQRRQESAACSRCPPPISAISPRTLSLDPWPPPSAARIPRRPLLQSHLDLIPSCRAHPSPPPADHIPPAAMSSAAPAAERCPLFGPASRAVPIAIVHPVTGARRLYLASAPACFASPCSSCTGVRSSKSSASVVRPKIRRGHGRTQLRCPVTIGADLHRRSSVVAALLLCCSPGPAGGRASPR